MRYLGGKGKIAHWIAWKINALNPQTYLEPFCGSCFVGEMVKAPAHRIFCDAHPQLIALWKAILSGWQPPETMTEELYRQARRGETSMELQGFIGFGCTFGGTWMGGYARSKTDPNKNFAKEAASALRRQAANLKDRSEFHNQDFEISLDAMPGDVVYCDPPYLNTSAYKGVAKMSHERFWAAIRRRAARSVVFISEYSAPDDFECVMEIPTVLTVRSVNGNEKRLDRVFQWKEGLREIPRDVSV